MAEPQEAGSTEQQADPAPTEKTVREAAEILAARRQELRQAPVEAQPEVQNAEPVAQPTETAETEAIDYESINFAEVAAPVGVERETDHVTTSDGSEQSFSFTYRGQEETVDLATARELAEQGRDYRKKTADLADQRRAVEAQQAQFQSEMESLRQDRERLAAQLDRFTKEAKAPDPELAQTDYEAFNEQMAQYQAAQLQAEQAAKELDEQREKESKAFQQKQAEAYEQHQRRLHSRVPDMAKQPVAHAVGRYLTEGMQFSGDELIRGVIAPADSRFQEMAYKAMMFDQARAKAKGLRAQPPKTSTGGQRSGMVQTGPQKPTGKDARDPRKVAQYLKQRKGAR